MQSVCNDKATAAQLKDMRSHKLNVKIESAREMYQSAIGAHPDQSMRNPFIPAVILSGICIQFLAESFMVLSYRACNVTRWLGVNSD